MVLSKIMRDQYSVNTFWRVNHKNSVPKLYLLLCTIMYIYNYVHYLV